MNKLVKGSIAGGLGIALLLGGASTFALWNQSLDAPAGNISTGTLTIADKATPAPGWTEQSTTGTANGAVGSALATTTTGSGAAAVTTVTPKMVPGDKWRYTRTVTITTAGKNLLADLTFDPASVVASTLGGFTPSELDYTFVATPVTAPTAGQTTITQIGSTNTYRVTPGSNGTVDVTLTLDVSFKDIVAGNNNAGQTLTAAINASALKFTLKQVRP